MISTLEALFGKGVRIDDIQNYEDDSGMGRDLFLVTGNLKGRSFHWWNQKLLIWPYYNGKDPGFRIEDPLIGGRIGDKEISWRVYVDGEYEIRGQKHIVIDPREIRKKYPQRKDYKWGSKAYFLNLGAKVFTMAENSIVLGKPLIIVNDYKTLKTHKIYLEWHEPVFLNSIYDTDMDKMRRATVYSLYHNGNMEILDSRIMPGYSRAVLLGKMDLRKRPNNDLKYYEEIQKRPSVYFETKTIPIKSSEDLDNYVKMVENDSNNLRPLQDNEMLTMDELDKLIEPLEAPLPVDIWSGT